MATAVKNDTFDQEVIKSETPVIVDFGLTSGRCYRFRKNCVRRRAILRAPAEFMPQEFLI